MSRYLNFSGDEDSRLIEIVQKYPVLYDISNKSNRDFYIRAKSWQAVASQMNRSVEDCKKRWRSMKDTYFRFKRKNTKTTWIWGKRLQFLESGRNVDVSASDETNQQEENAPKEEEMETASEEITINNIQEPDTASMARLDYFEEYHPYDQESTSESKYKPQGMDREDIIRLIDQKQRENGDKQTDPIFAFFHSMALTVKDLPPELIVEARMKICEVVGNLELKALRMMREADFSVDHIKIEGDETAFVER